eukprot:jgi/Psemu1/54759/gm1.54759_g
MAGSWLTVTLGESRLRLQVNGLRKYYHPGALAQASTNNGKAFGYLEDIKGCAGWGVGSRQLAPTTTRPSSSPFELVPFLLGKGLLVVTPRQAMVGTLVYPCLNHHGLVVGICKPLFDTLRGVAGTFPAAPAGDPTFIQPGPSFRSGPVLTVAVTAPTDRPRPAEAQHKHEKTHNMMIFQSQVATRAYELGIQPPLVTIAVVLKTRFQDCKNFHGTYSFDVADGILPLAFTPPGGSAETLLKQEQEAVVNDSLELQKTKKAYIPLESYLAVLATILGVTHEVLVTPAIVVYYFQIRVRGWLVEQWDSASTIPSPDFGEDFHRFQMTQNLNWFPNVSNVVALRSPRTVGYKHIYDHMAITPSKQDQLWEWCQEEAYARQAGKRHHNAILFI